MSNEQITVTEKQSKFKRAIAILGLTAVGIFGGTALMSNAEGSACDNNMDDCTITTDYAGNETGGTFPNKTVLDTTTTTVLETTTTSTVLDTTTTTAPEETTTSTTSTTAPEAVTTTSVAPPATVPVVPPTPAVTE